MNALLLALVLATDPEEVDRVSKLYGDLQLELSAGLDGDGDGVAPTASLFFREARVGVKGQVIEGVGYTVLVDLGTVNNLLRDAYAWTTLLPHHELRVGQQKTQFGYENPQSAYNLWIIDRAFISDELGRGPDLRDLGIGLFGQWDLPASFGLDYQLTAVDGAGPNVLADDTPRKNLWGRAGASYRGEGWTAALGISGATGDRRFKADPASGTPAYTISFERLGIDLRADTPWAFAVVEGALGRDDRGAGPAVAAGFYALAAGKTPWNVGPIFRVEAYDRDLDAPGDLRRRYTLGAYAELKKPANARVSVNLEIDGSETPRDHALVSWVQVVF